MRVRMNDRGVRNSWDALAVRTRTERKAASMRWNISLRVSERREISSRGRETGRRVERFLSLMRRISAAMVRTGLSARRLRKCPTAAAESRTSGTRSSRSVRKRARMMTERSAEIPMAADHEWPRTSRLRLNECTACPGLIVKAADRGTGCRQRR